MNDDLVVVKGENPYAVAPRQDGAVGSAAHVEASRAASEVQAQVLMARRFPRDPVAAVDRILGECDRPSLAEKAVYTYPRGGQQVSGPSVRLAESIARNWGNISCGIIEVERKGPESSMLAYAWDLETNVQIRKEFKVAHTRDTRQGSRTLTDERDIYEMTANQGARRLRACILGLIPGDVVDAAVERCRRTMTAHIGDLPSAIQKMVQVFDGMGVTKSQIEKRLRHRIEATNAAEIVGLRTIYESIRDGMGQPADYFEPEGQAVPEPEPKKKGAAAAMAMAASHANFPASIPSAEAKPVDGKGGLF